MMSCDFFMNFSNMMAPEAKIRCEEVSAIQ